VVFVATYICQAIVNTYRKKDGLRKRHALDVMLSLAVMGYLSWSYMLEIRPYFPNEELRKTFKPNAQDAYLLVFWDIPGFTKAMRDLKEAGFRLVMTLFLHHLSCHPRFALVVDVANERMDELFHSPNCFVSFYLTRITNRIPRTMTGSSVSGPCSSR